MEMTRPRLLFAFLALGLSAAQADTIHVPGDQPTIQAGIDAAQSGDVVLVAPGDYSGAGNVDLDFGGKEITVASETGPGDTRILLGGSQRAFLFTNGETPNAIVEGFAIEGAEVAGAVLCDASSPTFASCWFHNDLSEDNGGAASCINGSSPEFYACEFRDNMALFGSGGAVWTDGTGSLSLQECLFEQNTSVNDGGAVAASNVTASGCTFRNNLAGTPNEGNGGRGGAVSLGGVSTVMECSFLRNGVTESQFGGSSGGAIFSMGPLDVLRSLFDGNESHSGAGGALTLFSETTITESTLSANAVFNGNGGGVNGSATLVRTILRGNCAFGGEGAELFTGGTATFICCATDPAGVTALGGVDYLGDQVFEDPLFCGPGACDGEEEGDYTLRSDSPCLPGGSPCGELIGLFGEGCGPPIALEQTSWGRIKRRYAR